MTKTSKRRLIFENLDLNDFFSVEYNMGLELIFGLHKMKMTYQKMFIALMVSVGSISMAIFNYFGFSADKTVSIIGVAFGAAELIGLGLFVSSVMGYVIIRNLASIRRSESRYSNMVIMIRNSYIKYLKIDKYPNIPTVLAYNRRSADYLTIAILSLLDMFFGSAGLALLTLEANTVVSILIILSYILVYLVLYYYSVDMYLISEVKRGLVVE